MPRLDQGWLWACLIIHKCVLAQDECPSAVIVDVPASVLFDTGRATTSVESASCGSIVDDIWLVTRRIAPNSNVTVSTCGATTMHTVLMAYSSCATSSVPSPPAIACGTPCPGTNQSAMTFRAPGGPVYIRLGGSSIASPSSTFGTGLGLVDVEDCVPNTCESLNASCGTRESGCGGTIDCGDCPRPPICNTSGSCADVFVTGGWWNGVSLPSSYRYSTYFGNWSALPLMQQARFRHSMVALDHSLYVFGGEAPPGSYLASVERYDSTVGMWRTLPSLPSARSLTQAVVYNGSFLVLGGKTAAGLVNDVLLYDAAAARWDMIAYLPEPMCGFAAALMSDWLYIVGGEYTQTKHATTAYRLHIPTQVWTEIAPVPNGLALMGSAVVGLRLFVFGGYNGLALRKTYVYDSEEDAWTALCGLHTARFALAGVAVNNTLLALGGSDVSDRAVTTLELFDVAQNKWAAHGHLPDHMSAPAVAVMQFHPPSSRHDESSVAITVKVNNPVIIIVVSFLVAFALVAMVLVVLGVRNSIRRQRQRQANALRISRLSTGSGIELPAPAGHTDRPIQDAVPTPNAAGVGARSQPGKAPIDLADVSVEPARTFGPDARWEIDLDSNTIMFIPE
eukprot:TRINITY_DN4594_c0_g1_i1.p1 TRINITY_DN4594_c0_g1~~TRINITY_DN4594_c0_g1_i1.p1  ORF type:complete len:621 (+),score=155.11 TRINITY_DN4594_c0_g1_i1:95-1957(+)